VVVVCGLAVYAVCYRQQKGGQAALGELTMELTENPLPAEARLKPSMRGSLSNRARTTAKQSHNVYLLLRVLYQPSRILVSYIQVGCYKGYSDRLFCQMI
jgi:hypothetical protein